MLLSQLPSTPLSPALLHALGVNTTAALSTQVPLSLNYVSHIRHFNLQPDAIIPELFCPQGDSPPETFMHIMKREFMHLPLLYLLLLHDSVSPRFRLKSLTECNTKPSSIAKSTGPFAA